jgi:hypothetical protein
MALASVSIAAGGDLRRLALVSSPAVLLLTALLFVPLMATIEEEFLVLYEGLFLIQLV